LHTIWRHTTLIYERQKGRELFNMLSFIFDFSFRLSFVIVATQVGDTELRFNYLIMKQIADFGLFALAARERTLNEAVK